MGAENVGLSALFHPPVLNVNDLRCRQATLKIQMEKPRGLELLSGHTPLWRTRRFWHQFGPGVIARHEGDIHVGGRFWGIGPEEARNLFRGGPAGRGRNAAGGGICARCRIVRSVELVKDATGRSTAKRIIIYGRRRGKWGQVAIGAVPPKADRHNIRGGNNHFGGHDSAGGEQKKLADAVRGVARLPRARRRWCWPGSVDGPAGYRDCPCGKCGSRDCWSSA